MDDLNFSTHRANALNTILSHLKRGRKKNLLHMASGTGKGTVLVKLVEQLTIAWPNRSIQIIFNAKIQELQFLDRFGKLEWSKKNIHTAVLGSLINSQDNRSDDIVYRNQDVIILDEYIGSDRVIDYFERFPDAIKIAFSQIPEKSDYFGKLIYSYSVKDAIEDGLFVRFSINKEKIGGKNFYAADTGERVYTEEFMNTAASVVLEKTNYQKTIVAVAQLQKMQNTAFIKLPECVN